MARRGSAVFKSCPSHEANVACGTYVIHATMMTFGNSSRASQRGTIAFRSIVVPPARTSAKRLIGSRLPGGLGFIGCRSTAGSRPRLPSFVRLRRTFPTLSQVGMARRGSAVFKSCPSHKANVACGTYVIYATMMTFGNSSRVSQRGAIAFRSIVVPPARTSAKRLIGSR